MPLPPSFHAHRTSLDFAELMLASVDALQMVVRGLTIEQSHRAARADDEPPLGWLRPTCTLRGHLSSGSMPGCLGSRAGSPAARSSSPDLGFT